MRQLSGVTESHFVNPIHKSVLWCEIVVASFFPEFIFEGLQPESMPGEEIILEMSSSDFCHAIKIDRPDKTSPTQLKMKLSREDYRPGDKRPQMDVTTGPNETAKKQPVIVMQLQLEQLATGKVMTLTRDLKVEIVARRFWKEYIEPAMPEFDVSLFMPQLNKIKGVTDRMKNINKYIIVRGYKEGKLQLPAKSATMKTSVTFEKCDAPEWNTNDDEQYVVFTLTIQSKFNLFSQFNTQSTTEEASVRVPAKRLLDFTAGDQLKPTRCILNVLNQQLIHCFLLLGIDVNLQFLIPHVNQI